MGVVACPYCQIEGNWKKCPICGTTNLVWDEEFSSVNELRREMGVLIRGGSKRKRKSVKDESYGLHEEFKSEEIPIDYEEN